MKISILDCTLRDGGYINNFHFGASTIDLITHKLCEANIEIIECGFLRTGKNDPDYSLYGGVEQIKLPSERDGRMFVAMIEYGGIDAKDIVPCLPEYIDGIRLTFHNSEWEETKALALDLMSKGYKVFIQPVGTATYTDEELLDLINEVNDLSPFAFYLVDTLGSMYKNDLLRMFYLIDHNLMDSIAMGFHSHNNLQLSFANSMTLLELHSIRHIIIDSSVFGMGRGAGNLNTELITHFVNKNIEDRYELTPIMELIDDVILRIFEKNSWGFSAPYYLAAIRGVHPNYAQYLMGKQAIPIPRIGAILDKLQPQKRHLFSLTDIEDLYFNEMQNATDDSKATDMLRKMIGSRAVLVIAPGNSVRRCFNEITDFIKTKNPFVVTVNFVPEGIKPGLVFVGNIKRYLQLQSSNELLVLTSNIHSDAANTLTVDYESLLPEKRNSDSSGIMVLRMLIRLGVKSVFLAGYDGFSNIGSYYADSLSSRLSQETIQQLNINTALQIGELRREIEIEFITPTLYDEG